MGLMEGFRKRQAARETAKAKAAMEAKWKAVVEAAVADGAKYAALRDTKSGKVRVTIEDVPAKHWAALEGIWFTRIHAESDIFFSDGPPGLGYRSPNPSAATVAEMNRAEKREANRRR